MRSSVIYQQISDNRWRVHASVVRLLDGSGIIITGPPNSGKTTLAGCFLSQGATLVGDDYVDITFHEGELRAHRVKEISGLIAPRSHESILAVNSIPFAGLDYQIAMNDEAGVGSLRSKKHDDVLAFLPKTLPIFSINFDRQETYRAAQEFFAQTHEAHAI